MAMIKTCKVPTEDRTVSGSSVSFNSAFALPLKACKVSFSATQAGSGTPSPSNPRAISGVSAIGLTANSTPVSVSLGDTRYGGELDVLTGELTITRVYADSRNYDNTQWGEYTYQGNLGVWSKRDFLLTGENRAPYISNMANLGATSSAGNKIWCGVGGSLYIYWLGILDDLNISIDDFKSWIVSNPLEIVYELAEPITIQLSANELSSIIGNNTFSTDTGTLEITFADLQTKSASGSVASFNTALAMPLSSCNIAVNAWQEGSGDPSPDNVRAIHGFSEVNVTRTGINIKPNSGNTGTSEDVSVVYNSVDETYTLNGSGSGNILLGNYSNLDWKIGESYRISVHVISGSFTLGGSGQSTTYAVGIFNSKGTAFIRGGTNLTESGLESYEGTGFAFKSDRNYILYFQSWRRGTVFNDLKFKVQIEKNVGIATRPYVPYVTPTIYTIQLGQEVYGAEVDVVNGVAHVTHNLLDLGTLVYVKGNRNNDDTGFVFYAYYANAKVSTAFKCEEMKFVSGIAAWENMRVNEITHTGAYVVIVADYQTGADMRTAMTGVHLLYELNTPFDIQLTPTQIETIAGKTNTIFADTGDIDLTYKDLDIAKRGNFREVFKLP